MNFDNEIDRDASLTATEKSALGVYQSREQKQTRVELEFGHIATNATCSVEAKAATPSGER